MRQVTVTEKYRAVNEGQMDKQEFVRQMRLAFPSLINQFNGYDDSVSILRTKGLLFEEKTMKHDVSDESIRRALDTEITVLGHDPVTCTDSDVIDKARTKAIANLSKDPLHYYNLLAKESSKVDKNDKMKETKRGKLEKDTFNDMKKATLKERKENLVEGTRALVGYLAGDTLTTTYNHYDGYPSNLGAGLEAHYNDDEKAKDIAMKGYITYLNPETGEVESTHKDPAQKIKLPSEDEDMAREIADAINSMGGDFGYIWDDRSNRWITIKNTGTRSMIDQISSKLGDYAEVQEADLDETEEEYLEKRDAAIKQAMGKDVDEVDSSLDPYEDKKVIVQQVIDLLKTEKGAGNEVIKDFIKTHYEDIINLRDDQAILDEFEQFLSVNYDAPSDFMNEEKELDDVYGDGDVVVNISGMSPGMKAVWEIEKEISEFGDSNDAQLVVDNMIEINSEEHLISYLEERDIDTQTIVHMVKAYNSASVNEKDGYNTDPNTTMHIDDEEWEKEMGRGVKEEKADKDHDGDGEVESKEDEYKGVKDKAIKKAMGKKSNVNEAVKNIISKILEEQLVNEAATNDLAKIAAEYGDYEGLKPAVIALENVVTEIESFYDKTRSKIQKIYNDLGEIKNEEGLKVGAFIAPSIENAFKRDLRPITKQQFHGGLEMPKVKRISQDDIDRGYVQQEAPKQTVYTPVQENKKK